MQLPWHFSPNKREDVCDDDRSACEQFPSYLVHAAFLPLDLPTMRENFFLDFQAVEFRMISDPAHAILLPQRKKQTTINTFESLAPCAPSLVPHSR
jgi:hypothetical protein